MTQEAALTLTLVPQVALGLATLNGLAAVVFVVTPGLPMGPRFGGLVCFLASAVLLGLVVARRWGTLAVADTITYRRRSLHLELPLRDAVAVRVIRPVIPLRQPTSYALVTRVKGREYELPFAEHWLFGNAAQRRARALAARCGVSIEDPRGERWRASGNVLLRWLGDGEEWKLAVAVATVTLLLGGLAVALR